MTIERSRKRSYMVIDEGYSVISETSFLDVSVYDESGKMVFYTDFERGVGPKEIAESLEFFANQIVESYSDYDELKVANILRYEARRIVKRR